MERLTDLGSMGIEVVGGPEASPLAGAARDAVAVAFGSEDQHEGMRVAAVIPAFREDRFIGSVVLKTRSYVDYVIVVDDGSPDQTASIAREAGADVIVHSVNQGKAKALSTGFTRALEIGADVVVILDGDGQHNPAEIPQVIQPIIDGRADMVIGSRFQGTKSKIPVWRQVGQHSLTLMTNVASGVASSDSQSGFRAFHRDALATFNISQRGFSVESEMQFWAREQRLRVLEAPISVIYAEKAKRNPVKQALQVMNGILALVSQMRPLLFFGLAGLALALVGAGFWYQIVRTFDVTRQLALGHALLATLFITVGVLSAFEGVTLHILREVMRGHQPARPARRQPLVKAAEDGDLAAVRVSTTAQPVRRVRKP